MPQRIRVPVTDLQSPAEVSLTIRAPEASGRVRVPVGELQSSPTALPEWFMEAPTTPRQTQRPSHLREFAGEVGHAINPVEMAKGLYGMATNLTGTLQGMGQAQGRLFQDAEAAFNAGDYITAGRKFANYLMPVLGPMLDRSSDLYAEGRYGAGTGAMAGLGIQAALPAALRRVPGMRARVAPRNPNPAERSAVEFGMREGVPVDAATATGNTVVRGSQWLAERTGGGSVIGGRARQRLGQALSDVGDRLATRTSRAPVTAEQAGQGVRDAVSARASQLHADASAAYDRLRAIESAAPPQTVRVTQPGRVAGGGTMPVSVPQQMRLAVDIAPTKTAMQPIYNALKRESELVPLMGDKARALTALDRLMNAHSQAPLSVADAALSELKALARVDEGFRRTTGQGVAAQAVANLERSVMDAARRAGPEAVQALTEGRQATIGKYTAIHLLDRLNTEPVRVFNQLTANRDSAVQLLREVQRHAPTEMPRIGRATLEGMLEKATAEGGFGRTAGIYADWHRLGGETKRLLFRSPALVRDLDDFFLLAKKAAENPNPSGSAFVAGVGAQGAMLWANPALGVALQAGGAALVKLLHSPRAVRVIVRGLRVPLGNRAASVAAATELSAIARESGVRLVPATAEIAPGAAPPPQRAQPRGSR